MLAIVFLVGVVVVSDAASLPVGGSLVVCGVQEEQKVNRCSAGYMLESKDDPLHT